MAKKEARWGPLFKKKAYFLQEQSIWQKSIRIWIAGAIHMLKGINVDALFLQKTQQQKRPNNKGNKRKTMGKMVKRMRKQA